MEVTVNQFIQGLTLGTAQQHKGLACFPLYSHTPPALAYLGLAAALAQGNFLVSEVDQAGSVPNLKVTNQGSYPVLLMDGEELMGAKQNRVLNTSILVTAEEELVIPVSCTESGRWAYTSAHFGDSDNMLTPALRTRKSRSVSNSLRRNSEFRSDQAEVWAGIETLMTRSSTSSARRALRDILVTHRAGLEEYEQACPLTPEQVGILVALDGKPVALDVVSQPEVWTGLHAKLVRSYATELLGRESESTETADLDSAHSFLQGVLTCRESRFKSPGMGDDHRFEGEQAIGSALVVDGEVIHTAFFAAQPLRDEAATIASLSRRRGFRRNWGDQTE